MKKTLGVIAVVTIVAGCGEDATDYQQLAEEASVEAAEEANPGLSATASCEEPGSTDVGTTFDCTVTYDDGDQQPVLAVITDDGVRVEGG